MTSTKNSRGKGLVIARWKDSLLERSLLGTSTRCRVSLPLLVEVEHDFVPRVPKEKSTKLGYTGSRGEVVAFY